MNRFPLTPNGQLELVNRALDDMVDAFDRYVSRTPEQIAAEEQQRQHYHQWQISKLERRAASECNYVVGKPFTVRISKTCTVSGIITDCKLAGVKQNPRSAIAMFDVTMECGQNKTLRTFTVSKLPR